MIGRIFRIALVLLLACPVLSKAQDLRNSGFIGVGLGPSFLVGNSNVKAGTGLNLTLLNGGYVWGKGFGITGVWAGGAHAFDGEHRVYDEGGTLAVPARVELSYGVLMIGPMYSLNLTDDSALDFKVRLGTLFTREKSTSEVSAMAFDNMRISASFGVGYRKKVADRWSLMLSSDYYAARQQYNVTAGQNAHILSFTTGVGFVL